MALEIERKFLVTSMEWRDTEQVVQIRQGYLATGPPVSVRVRIVDGDAELTVKKEVSETARYEYNLTIPVHEAEDLLDEHCEGYIIEKRRHLVKHDDMTWEIDEFTGANKGLIVAEVEFDSPDATLSLPSWVGEEITDQYGYRNSNLAVRPYTLWNEK